MSFIDHKSPVSVNLQNKNRENLLTSPYIKKNKTKQPKQVFICFIWRTDQVCVDPWAASIFLSATRSSCHLYPDLQEKRVKKELLSAVKAVKAVRDCDADLHKRVSHITFLLTPKF